MPLNKNPSFKSPYNPMNGAPDAPLGLSGIKKIAAVGEIIASQYHTYNSIGNLAPLVS